MDDDYKHSDVIDKIIKAFYNVYNRLGYGFLEKVYERAFMIELKKLGLRGNTQVPVTVYYDGEEVGNYFADALVENSVIVEFKTGEGLIEQHEAQLVNYLKATKIEVGLLLNFGLKPSVQRKVYSNRK